MKSAESSTKISFEFSFVVGFGRTGSSKSRTGERKVESGGQMPPSLHVLIATRTRDSHLQNRYAVAHVASYALCVPFLNAYTRSSLVSCASRSFRVVRDNGMPFRSTDFSIDFAMLDIVDFNIERNRD